MNQFLIEEAKESAKQGMEMFLRNFAHVPDDKLNWSPAPTAKSALRVAAHTALYAGRFANMIATRQIPGGDRVEEWVSRCEAEERAVTDRAEIERIFRTGTAEVIAAIDSLSAADLDLSLDSGLGWSMPMKSLIKLPGWHATLHVGQIDFLQTCWGDNEVHLS